MAGTRNWREIRGERSLNETRVETFRRLMAAQEQIAKALIPYGLSDERLDAALAAAEDAVPHDERAQRGQQAQGQEQPDFYLSALDRYVTMLGGRLEVAADHGAPVAAFPGLNVVLEPRA